MPEKLQDFLAFGVLSRDRRHSHELSVGVSERLLDHQWLISNGSHFPQGFGHPPLSLRNWKTCSFRRLRTMACLPGRSARREENGANGTSSPRGLPTPSRRPKRRRSSKRKQHRGCHNMPPCRETASKGGMKIWSRLTR